MNVQLTRRVACACVGYGCLLLAKRRSESTLLKRIGYVALLGTPSYTHFYDIFAAAPLVLALGGETRTLSPMFAVYYAMALTHPAPSYFATVARTAFATALAFGGKNPVLT